MIQSLQWVKATNSLLFSGDAETLQKLAKLVDRLDIPLRQVFIEVLVIETDVKKSMEFGCSGQPAVSSTTRWALGWKLCSRQPVCQWIWIHNARDECNQSPTGLDQIPLVPGFDLGVIGDIIMHKGKSYLTLALWFLLFRSMAAARLFSIKKSSRRTIRIQPSLSATIFLSQGLLLRQ